MRYLLDTNILIYDCDSIDNYEEVVICNQSLEELDGLKKDDGITGFKARKAIKKLEQSNVQYVVKDLYDVPEGWEKSKRDNCIILCAKENGCILVSNDINVLVKAKSIGLQCEKYEKQSNVDIYTGYKEVIMTQEEQSVFYQCMNNDWNLLINEYLIIRDKETGEVIDRLKWINTGFTPISKNPLTSMMFGKFKPRDVYQELAIDSLNNEDLTIFFGSAGTAKTLISLAYMFQKLQNNKIDRIIICHNSPPLNKSTQLGYYSGSRLDKLLQSSLGGILASKLGDITMVETMVNQGKLVLMPLADIRGFETTEKSILFVTEAQNMDRYLLKTVLQRAKDGTKVIIEGDIEDQVDHYAFANEKNGMRRAIEVFKGKKEFSCVKLKNIYRGRIAEIANDM